MDIKWIYKFHLYNISIGKHFQVSKSKKLERVESSPLPLSYELLLRATHPAALFPLSSLYNYERLIKFSNSIIP